MGLNIAQLSARLRCAECGGQLHSVKPWRMEDVLESRLGAEGECLEQLVCALYFILQCQRGS